MGIRVHKFLGYGLTDLDPGSGDHWRTDHRVNWASPLLTYDDPDRASAAAYWDWLEGRRRAAGDKFRFGLDWATLRHEEKTRQEDLCQCVAYQPEYGLREVLAIRPLGKPGWSRYDDDIDYMEETYPWSEGSQKNHVQVFEHGPYPFIGSYMDARTGSTFNGPPGELIMWWHRLRNDGKPGEERDQLLDKIARECGFAGHAEALANVAPAVPHEIRDLAEFGQLFAHAGVWRQLRPVLYTYWS